MLIQSLRSKLYFVTPDPPPETRELCALVRAAVQGGVGIVQYRAKGRTTAQMLRDAAALLQVLRRVSVPLIINDRADVALAVGADGVHVGQDDMPVDVTRRLMGPKAIIGATCRSLAQATEAEAHTASYVSIGPVFATTTKPELAPVGAELIGQVRLRITIPICAIGGITPLNMAELAPVNPDLVAVVTAISTAPDPQEAAQELSDAIREQLRTRPMVP
jgi:thiamine-phosphate pyrophosphorylase